MAANSQCDAPRLWTLPADEAARMQVPDCDALRAKAADNPNPERIEFVDSLPKIRPGKIMRDPHSTSHWSRR